MSEIFFRGLNSIFMQIPPFVSLCKYGIWSHEQTHSIRALMIKKSDKISVGRLVSKVIGPKQTKLLQGSLP